MLRSLPKGTLVANRYRILSLEIGSYSMFRGEDTQTQRRVVLEDLGTPVPDTPEMTTLALREAKILVGIRHANLVEVIDVVHDAGVIIVVAELLDGMPLQHALLRGAVSIPELIAILIAAMRGVAEVHRRDAVHGQITPSHIFLSEPTPDQPPVTKVLSLVDGHIRAKFVSQGKYYGDLSYTSPEHLRRIHWIDQRADVYSFGVVLYEALTGRLPFGGSNLSEYLVDILTGTPLSLTRQRPGISPALDQIVQRAMARQPEDRFPSLDAFVAELQPFAAEDAFPMRQLFRETHPRESPSATLQRRMKPTLSWIQLRNLTLLLLLAAVCLVVSLMRGASFPQ